MQKALLQYNLSQFLQEPCEPRIFAKGEIGVWLDLKSWRNKEVFYSNFLVVEEEKRDIMQVLLMRVEDK